MTDEKTNIKIKVLIVDDSRLTRISLKTTLQENKDSLLYIGEAENGKEGVEAAEKLRPSVILMDIGMPIMDGITATQKLKELCPDIHVVMLTSHESEEDVLASFRSGATSYCLKDTPPEVLVQAILSTAKGDAWIDPKIAKVVLNSLNSPTTGTRTVYESSSEGEFPFSPLTERETEVLKLITEGLNNTDIAERLCVSMNTVKTHIKNIFLKLEVEDRTAAALKALKEKII